MLAAVDAKKDAEKHSKEAPGAFREAEAERRLAETEVEGTVAGGQVTVKVNGTGDLVTASFGAGLVAAAFTFFRGEVLPFLCLVCLAMQSYSVLSPSRGSRLLYVIT